LPPLPFSLKLSSASLLSLLVLWLFAPGFVELCHIAFRTFSLAQSSLNSFVTELTLSFYHILKGLLDEDEAADWILAFLPFILLV